MQTNKGASRSLGAAPTASEPATAGRAGLAGLIRFGAVAAQFALIVGIFKLFDIENPALFNRLGPLMLVGFVLHHLLPVRFRLGFFALLSVVSVFAIFAGQPGGPIVYGVSLGGWQGAAWLLGTGVAMILACHVPAPFVVRCALVLALGAGLALVRVEWAPLARAVPIPPAIWPILGSMFMFRLANYLYDMRHKSAPFGPARALAYFFMLPNVLFTLFPVVDYKTFCRSHYNDDAMRIYQVGLRWMIRGVIQLLIYRQIYNNYMIDPATVTTAGQAGQYVLTTFLLYLKLSGTFHLIVGILHLFGFNLPETHHLYLLSSSFTDFWRRINIYWKDFIQKLVFYPLFFRLKRIGEAKAIAIATILAFLATWLLHSYQWFWIRSAFPIEWHDFIFWMGLALLVVVNTRWEQRKGRKRTLKAPKRTFKSEAIHALCVAGTFTAICALWTIWSTPDIGELRTVAGAFLRATPGELLLILSVPVAIGVAGALLRGKTREHTEGGRSADKRGKAFPFWLYAAEVMALCVVVAGVGARPNVLKFNPDLRDAVVRLKENKLNRQDIEGLERGYYEDLGDVTRFNSDLWKVMGGKPKNWDKNEAIRQRDDVLGYDLLPNIKTEFKGAPFSTNSLGMRDREYTAAKAPGVFRIALIGSSHDYGSGVRDNETYENLTEDRLNAERAGPSLRYEIVNLSCGGYAPLQKALAAQMKARELSPDLIVYVANSNELSWAARGFERVAKSPDSDVGKWYGPALAEGGVVAGDSQMIIERKMTAHRERLMALVFGALKAEAESHGARAAVAMLQKPSDIKRTPEVERILAIAAEAGLPTVDMWGALDGVSDRKRLHITAWDDHTNVEGHQLLARAFYDALVKSGLLPPAPSGAGATP